ncbi:MAG TPA: glycosyltransferase, partial [Anaerolineales bacterium]|nr:glycosyltransferase [Anaerolineales bacterium]
MKVLFINSRPNAAQIPGGDTVQMWKSREALDKLGVDVESVGAEALEGPLPACDLAHLFNLQDAQPAWALMERLQKAGIPVVLSPIYWDMTPFWYENASTGSGPWARITRLLGKRVTANLYSRWQRTKAPGSGAWRSQRRLLQTAQRVQPNSRSETALLRRLFGLGRGFEAKVDVVPNAVDPILEGKAAGGESIARRLEYRDFILEVGTIYPVKNQLGLIEALFDLPVPIVFVGQMMEAYADYAAACRSAASRRGNVIFLEHLPHEQLPEVYRSAAVHALPSWRETPGLVSLEAAAAGCKIVSTSIGSARDYFGDEAWYCHPSDPASIRTAVEVALAAPRTPALEQRVKKEFTWERTAEAMLASYRKVLHARPQAAPFVMTGRKPTPAGRA